MVSSTAFSSANRLSILAKQQRNKINIASTLHGKRNWHVIRGDEDAQVVKYYVLLGVRVYYELAT